MKILLVADSDSFAQELTKITEHSFTITNNIKHPLGEYDIVHFLSADLMNKSGVYGDIVNIMTPRQLKGDYSKCLRVIFESKSMAISYSNSHAKHGYPFNHQVIERHIDKYRELYKMIYFEKTSNGSIYIDHPSDSLMVSFGGLGARYNFWNVMDDVKVKKLFLMDRNVCWYYKGINREYNSHEKIAEYIRRIQKDRGVKYTVCVGDSAGASIAIIIGNMIKADAVLAFSPQTFIDKETRKYFGDNKWDERVAEVYKISNGFNLNKIKYNNKTSFHIFYSHYYDIDRKHAEYINKNNRFNIYPIPFNRHGAAGKIKENGVLKKLLISCCENKQKSFGELNIPRI